MGLKIKALQHLRSDEKLEDNGKWAEIAPGIEFLIRRIRSKTVMDARRRIYGPHERAMNGKELPEAIETNCTIQLMAQAVVADWRGDAMVDENTQQPIPFSVEAAVEIFSDPETGRDTRGIVLGFANDGDFYAPEDTQIDLGNSSAT